MRRRLPVLAECRTLFQLQRLFLAVLVLLVVLPVWGGQASGNAAARYVVVISLDGMCPAAYLSESSQVRLSNLMRLKQAGSYAEGVMGIYPSVTYPSHTTLVTGRLPAEHGIYTNTSSREAGRNADDWFWYASAIKVPALWDEARRHHLTVAGVSWPVTAGAVMDWNLPEVWDPAKGETLDLQYAARFATPGLIPELVAHLGPPAPEANADTLRTRVAAYLVKKYQPNLLFVHLLEVDTVQHQFGPGTPQAMAALERVDGMVGEILRAVEDAGLKDSTDVFVVSDHGFMAVERRIKPNVLLAKAGLLTLNEKGQVTGGKVTTIANGGSFFIYWPEGQELRGKVDAALKPLREQGVLWGAIDRPGLVDLGAEPAVQLALEAPDGGAFRGGATGEVVERLSQPHGTHGYLPFRPRLDASFVACGPSIKTGVNLHRIPMTTVAPTLLKALGINNPQFGAEPALADIFK